MVDLKKGQTVFSQGEPAETVFYIQSGQVKLSVISSGGKEATIALLGAKDFLGEECVANAQPRATSYRSISYRGRRASDRQA